MGNTREFPCANDDPDHDGTRSAPVEGTVVNVDQTRYFAVVERNGNVTRWRTNTTAPVGNQVQRGSPGGGWRHSFAFVTEGELLRSLADYEHWETDAEGVRLDG